MMKNQSQAFLLVFLIAIMIPMCNGILDQDPKAVESWIENIGSAKEKITKLQFYWDDNSTYTVNIANASSSTSPTLFRLTSIVDFPLRKGPKRTSKVVGRAQGLLTASDQQELSFTAAFNVEFTEGKLNGSTLSLLGRMPLTHTHPYVEISIVGGSGVFRLARGILTFNLTSAYPFFFKCNMVVLHYN